MQGHLLQRSLLETTSGRGKSSTSDVSGRTPPRSLRQSKEFPKRESKFHQSNAPPKRFYCGIAFHLSVKRLHCGKLEDTLLSFNYRKIRPTLLSPGQLKCVSSLQFSACNSVSFNTWWKPTSSVVLKHSKDVLYKILNFVETTDFLSIFLNLFFFHIIRGCPRE